MRLRTAARRLLTPGFVVSLICWARWRAKVSPRAEIELSDYLSLGPGCVISSFCKIKSEKGTFRVGKNVQIATHCFLSSDSGGVTIGDETMIGPQVCVIGSNYSYDRLDQPISMQPITSKGIRIGKNVWIGAGAAILDGADIGDNVIITPNSVVSRRVPANEIVLGNPAKTIFTRR